MSFIKVKVISYNNINKNDSYISLKVKPVDEKSKSFISENFESSGKSFIIHTSGRAFYTPSVDDTVVIRGKVSENNDGFKYFEFNSIFPAHFLEKSNPNIQEILESKIFESIDSKDAQQIGVKYGKGIIPILEKEPEKLVNDGFKLDIQAVKRDWSKAKMIAHDVEFMKQLGFSYDDIAKLFDIFNEHPHGALNAISRNPYRLIDYFPISTIDNYIKNLYWEEDSYARLSSIVDFFYNQSISGGSTGIYPKNLLDSVKAEGVNPHLILNHMRSDMRVGIYNMIGDVLQSKLHARLEEETAQHLADYLTSYKIDDYSNLEPDEDFLTDEQRNAVKNCVSTKLAILTGGPGRGKTTVIKAIMGLIRKASNNTQKIVCMAPTSQAAKRMSESIGEDCFTVHEAIGFNQDSGFYSKVNKQVDADVIIVDEVSMLDLYGLSRLIKSLKSTTRLILVGDKDQLPSVEIGNVIEDLISIEQVKTSYLTTPIRFGEHSEINDNAMLINQGETPALNQNRHGSWHVIPTENDFQTQDKVIKLCQGFIPGELGIDHSRIQVLSAQYETPIGVNTMNDKLKPIFNPPGRNSFNAKLGGKEFRVGDRIVITKRIKDKNIPNGAVGEIKYIDFKGKKVSIEFDGETVALPLSIGRQMELSYSKTIHKSQGTECDAIIIPISKSNKRMLNRKLIYTAVTRAKQQVFIVGDVNAFLECIKDENQEERISFLSHRIKENIEKNLKMSKEISAKSEELGVPFQ